MYMALMGYDMALRFQPVPLAYGGIWLTLMFVVGYNGLRRWLPCLKANRYRAQAPHLAAVSSSASTLASRSCAT
jgi:hypothetical protein